MKFQRKSALMMFLLGSILLFTCSIAYYFINRHRTIEQTHFFSQEIVNEVAHAMDIFLLDRKHIALTMASAPLLNSTLIQSNSEYATLSDMDRPKRIDDLNKNWLAAQSIDEPIVQGILNNPSADYLRAQQMLFPDEYGEIFLTNRYGVVVASTGKLTTFAHAHKYWWKGSYDEGKGITFFDDRGYDESVDGYVLGVVVPIKQDDEIIGILKINLNIMDALSEVIKSHGIYQASETLKLVRTGGQIVLEKGHDPLSTRAQGILVEEMGRTVTNSFISWDNEKPELIAYSPVKISFTSENCVFGGSSKSIDHSGGNEGEGWYITYSVPLNFLLKDTVRTMQSIVVIGIVFSFVISIAAWLLSRNLAQPILKLVEQSAKIGQGDFHTQVDIESKDELGVLSSSFNMMAQALHETKISRNQLIEDLSKSEEQYLEHSPMCTKMVDLDFNLQYMSTAGVEALNIDDITQFYGKPYPFDFYPESFRNIMTSNLKKVKKTGEIITQEAPVVDIDGNELWFHSTLVPVNDDDGLIEYLVVVSMDITERKRADRSLQESEEKFRSLFEQAGDYILILEIKDDDLVIADANQAACKTHGYTHEAFLGTSIMHLDKGLDKEDVQGIMGRIMSGESVLFETAHAKKDGTIFPVEVSSKLLEVGNGPTLIISIERDITNRKQAEERDKQQQYYLEKSQELGKIGTWALDLRENILRWTDENCRIFGVPPGSMANYEIFISKVHPDDREYVNHEWMAGMAGKPYDIEHRLLIDGVTTWVREKADVTFDENGEAVSAIGFTQDITERKQAEEHIQQANEQLQNAIHNMPNAYILWDTELRVIEWNKAAEEIFGYSREEMLGKNATDYIVPRDARHLVGDVFRKLQVGVVTDYSEKDNNLRKDGTLISCHWFNAPLVDDEGRVFAIITQAQDITKRKRVETYQRLCSDVISILQGSGELQDIIQQVLESIDLVVNCDAIGMRLKAAEDFPYFTQKGFSDDFVLKENTLIARDSGGGICRDASGNICLECTCGLVISGNTDPSNPSFTEAGSCWTNDSYPMLELPKSADPRNNPRNTCIHSGYGSVALIPIRTKHDTIGILQLNAKRKNAFNLDLIQHLEMITGNIGQALTRKQAEESLCESEETYKALIEGIPDIVIRFDRDGRHLFVSENVNTIVDIPAAQFIGKTHRDLGFPEINCQYWENAIRKVFESGHSLEDEFSFAGKDGELILNWRITPEFTARGEVCSALSICRNITHQRRLEQDYQTLFREMLDGFALHEIICDKNGQPENYRFMAINPAFEEMTGLKAQDVIGKTVLDVLPSTEAHWISTYGKVALTGEPIFFENYSQEIGKHFEVTAFRPAPNQFACIFADVTKRKQAEGEREKLENQLRQAQKMEAVGQLAGGVAHDFNNILQAVLGYGDIARFQIEEGSPARESIEGIMTAGDRAKTLVKQLLAFSRRQVLEMKDVNLNDVIDDLMKMIRRVIGEHITVDFICGRNLGIVHADKGQVEQIIMNLCVNARDAMPDAGKILIKTENVKLDEQYCSTHAQAKPGRYVRLSVTDTGCGMNAETLSKVFEPFFTTKELGKGTGLGLATIYGLVKQHHGTVDVYSEIDQGTTFKVYLPVVERAATSAEDEIKVPVPKGTETILLAEDDETVRKLAKGFLEKAGYTVLSASDGEEAIKLFDANDDKIDFALLDVMMPKQGGKAVFKHIQKKHPEVRVLFCSGYSMNAIHTNFVLDDGLALIQKPYQHDDLMRKIREILDK